MFKDNAGVTLKSFDDLSKLFEVGVVYAPKADSIVELETPLSNSGSNVLAAYFSSKASSVAIDIVIPAVLLPKILLNPEASKITFGFSAGFAGFIRTT